MLIAHQDALECRSIGSALEHAGLKVHLATNVEGLADIVTSTRPDVLILGETILTHTRELVGQVREASRSILIVLVDSEEPSAIVRELDRGADHATMVPVDPHELVARVRRLVVRR